MTISQRINKLRKERNMSQAVLAERAGLKAPAISQYESGARSPNFESLIKLSSALGVPSDYLLVGEESAPYEESSDRLSRMIMHVAGMLPFDKRELLLDYALMLLGPGPVRLNLPYFNDVRSYADYIFHQVAGNTLPVDLSGLLERFKVTLTETEMDNCEGILVQGNENLIILDPRQNNQQRRRFTLAVLLGHLIIPWHTETVYRAREESTFKTEDPREMEAL
ncbi:MAG: helix-turn-helix transcriptional regulator, partial [Syntrophomonas sp.]